MSLVLAFCHEFEMLEDGKRYMLDMIRKAGVSVIEDSDVKHLVLVSSSDDILYVEADRLDIMKLNKNGQPQVFHSVDANQFANFGSKNFFLDSERNFLLQSILEQVLV
jgi:hypothetical protein